TNQKKYIDSNGRVYYRVSVLKGKGAPTEAAQDNAAKRGNVVDELTRKFFTFPINKNIFKEEGLRLVAKLNKQSGAFVTFEPEFFDQLYDILDQYAKEFEEKGYTIYANIPSVAGDLGSSKNNGYAGTIDLLAYDRNKGHYVLIDLKTTST